MFTSRASSTFCLAHLDLCTLHQIRQLLGRICICQWTILCHSIWRKLLLVPSKFFQIWVCRHSLVGESQFEHFPPLSIWRNFKLDLQILCQVSSPPIFVESPMITKTVRALVAKEAKKRDRGTGIHPMMQNKIQLSPYIYNSKIVLHAGILYNQRVAAGCPGSCGGSSLLCGKRFVWFNGLPSNMRHFETCHLTRLLVELKLKVKLLKSSMFEAHYVVLDLISSCVQLLIYISYCSIWRVIQRQTFRILIVSSMCVCKLL